MSRPAIVGVGAVLLGFGLLAATRSSERTAEPSEGPRWTQSPLAISSREGLIYAASRDSSRVVALDLTSGRRAFITEVGKSPRYLDIVKIGGRRTLVVSCEGSGQIWLLDPTDGRVRSRLEVGPGPRGFTPLGRRLLAVAHFPQHRVSLWDVSAGREVASLPVGRFPTAVQAAGDRLWVSDFFGEGIQEIDWKQGRVLRRLELPALSNQVSSFLLDGDTLYIPHLLSNTIQPTLHLANTVFPAVSVLPLGRQGSFKLDLAFIDRPVNGPEALAIWHRGRFLAAVNSRSNDLTVIDLEDRLLEAHIPVGRFPVGMVIEPDGERAYVYNAHDHTISVVSLGALREIERWPVDEEVLPANLARGRDIFHDADSLNMTLNQWVSCSNCHPDGHSDGRVWQLPGKPRLRTKDLRGLLATLPAGWNATQDEMQDEEIFIRNFHLGLGLSEKEPHAALGPPNAGLSADLDALSEYVYSLAVTPSPNLIDGRLSQPAERGRTLFFSSQLGCVGCHPPPSFTVSRLADNPRYEGLLAPELDPVPPVDVPSLLGLWRQPRLLHDGRAERPLEVFTHWNQQDRHGRTSHLSEAELLDLEAFLLSLPYATVPPQPAAPRTEKEGSE